MNQNDSNLSANDTPSIPEADPMTDKQPVTETKPGVADHDKTSASSATHLHTAEEMSGADERDSFLAAMQHALPDEYFWCPEENRIYNADNGKAPQPICGPIRIVRYLRTTGGNDWSWEVAFLDRDGKLRHEVVSIAQASASPSSLGNRLSGLGFDLVAKSSDLCKPLSARPVEDRGLIVTRSGWVDTSDGKGIKPVAYVQPDGTLHLARAAAGLSISYSGTKAESGKVGSLEGWQNSVAKLALDNPALLFSICVALSGPMLKFSDIDTMGFNFFAQTSSGKTHALKAAASCGDDPATILRWNGTAAGLAQVTAAANDRALLLDEFPHNPSSDISDALYSIGNGTGRISANKKADHSRVALLSTSEKRLPEMFAHSRRTMPEGLGMRLLDIPARSWTYGIINNLHGYSDGHTFLLGLSRACSEHHGHALPYFIDIILGQNEAFINLFREILARCRAAIMAALGISGTSAPGQVNRTVERFALVAAVGEVAIAKRLLPWPRHTALAAATELAVLWYGTFITRQPRAPSEFTGILSAYIAENIDQFTDLETGYDADGKPGMGWKDNTFIYLQSRALNADILNGETIREVAQRLEDAGLLVRGSEARSLQYKMPESLVRARPRVYRLRRAALAK